MTTSIGGTTGVTFPDASVQNTAATGFGFKNRLINGAMQIDQRNAGASVTPTSGGVFTVDRWSYFSTQSSKMSIQQVSDAPVGFTNSVKITTVSPVSIGSSDIFSFFQPIEGYNVADFNFGSASAKTFTVSFWVKSSLTGTFGGSMQSSTGARGYAFSYTINAANTWEQKSVTIAGDTTGTWNTGNTAGITIYFGLGVGSTYSVAPGSWTATSYVNSATGATSVVGTNGATFYITGVQLEKGSTATAFDYRPYGSELALCQRYYEMNPPMSVRNSNGTIPSTAGSTFGNFVGINIGTWSQIGTSGAGYAFNYIVPKRAAPTVTLSNRGTAYSNVVETYGGGGTASYINTTPNSLFVYANQTVNGAASYIYLAYEATAEL